MTDSIRKRAYIGYSFILGLSGAMMPGPVLAVTITKEV